MSSAEMHAKFPIVRGKLTIIDPEGQHHVLAGPYKGPCAVIRISDPKILRRIMVLPDLYLGEGYMDGAVTIEQGSLYDVLEFCACNLVAKAVDATPSSATSANRRDNVVGRARDNVAHHYDLNRSLFTLFLDKDLQYSCAYFASDTDSLEQAQQNKKERIAAKLLLKPGMRVLDIGSGFGGLALYLARNYEVEVIGVTLSAEQYEVATARARAERLSDRVSFKLHDYREEDGCYDRIVSVGMFEHVGRGHYDEFFTKICALLAGDGICLLHSIGRMAPPGSAMTWITKYIFPGAYTPSLSETTAAVERSGLWVTDVEILRLHYAFTLREWNRRFQENRDKARALYDERFCRMWEYYFQLCEIAFRHQNWMVFQMQLAKHVGTVPLTRSYLHLGA
jgi:cyclopropane-fatty-acyl-phospholipid synthase